MLRFNLAGPWVKQKALHALTKLSEHRDGVIITVLIIVFGVLAGMD